jgi:hypothetical protein
MTHDVGAPKGAIPSDDQQQWLAREKHLIKWLDGRIKFYSIWAEFNRYGQRLTSLVILVCAVLAPVAVTSKSGAGLGVFDLKEATIGRIALIVTLLIGVSEGLRRLFRFDRRWLICANCREELLEAKEEYLDSQIGIAIGSEEWVKHLQETRAKLINVVSVHLKDFAEMLQGAEDAARKRR